MRLWLLQVHLLHALLHLGERICRLSIWLAERLLLLREVEILLRHLHVRLLVFCGLRILLRLRLGHCLLVVVYGVEEVDER